MWDPLRAASSGYQWISTVPRANSAGLSLTSINLLWPCLEPHLPTGSYALLPPPSSSLLTAALNFHLLCFPPSLWLTLLPSPRSPSHIPPSSSPLSLPASFPPSDLTPALNLSPVKWCTRNAEVVNLWGVRSIKQGQAERCTRRKCILCWGWAQQAINPAIQAVCRAKPAGRPHHCPLHLKGAKDSL